MEISFPFNATNQSDRSVLPSTKAFLNKNAPDYPNEKQRADQLGVPRAEKGSAEFLPLLQTYRHVKWAYTVFRKLHITPENFKREEIPHSIAAGNSPVFCAGLAEFRDGTVYVNNWTGHYRVEADRAASDIIEAWAGCGLVVHVTDLIRQ